MKRIGLLLSVLSIIGCANNPLSSYKSTTDTRLSTINNSNSLNSVIAAQETDDVLYNMEFGTVLRMQANYESSNIYYTKAQNVIDTWIAFWTNSTQGQVSDTVTSLLVNDNATDYDPRGYEKTLLPTMHALNQIGLNNFDAARIEIKKMYQSEQAVQNHHEVDYEYARQENAKIQKDRTDSYLDQQIKKNYNFQDVSSPEVLALTNSYQSAFSHYLAGFVFEALNEPSLARPGYLNSGKLQPNNILIQQSIDNLDKGQTKKSGFTNLLMVQEVGHAPQIKSNEVHIPIDLNVVGTNSTCVNMINVFYPTLVEDKWQATLYQYQLDNNVMTPVMMTNVNLMAAKALSEEMPHIITRNVFAAARNIALSQASCSTGGSIGTLLSLGTSIGGLLLDKADERNWNLLPAQYNVNRVSLPYGKHTISINVAGKVYTQEINLTNSYQVFSYRIIGNKVFFEPQVSMLK